MRSTRRNMRKGKKRKRKKPYEYDAIVVTRRIGMQKVSKEREKIPAGGVSSSQGESESEFFQCRYLSLRA